VDGVLHRGRRRPSYRHESRNTFITYARRCGAQEDVVERITHNAKGSIVDQYTDWHWGPLCEAVICLKYDPAAFRQPVRSDANSAYLWLQRLDSNQRPGG
jgi:hypothetical protein